MEEIKEQAAKVRAMQEREAVYTAAAGSSGAGGGSGSGGGQGSGGGIGAGADDGYGRVITFRDEKTLLQRMA